MSISPFLRFDVFYLFLPIKIFYSILILLFFPIISISFLIKYINLNFSILSEFFPRQWFKSEGIIISSLLFIIIIINIISLYGYGFAPWRHIGITFFLGLTLWLTSVFINFSFKFLNKISHFIPSGTPSWLLPLLGIVEIASEIIRPITLSVRLAANITAGHIILNLFSFSLISSLLGGRLILILETLVAIVQPIVITLLRILYIHEI